MQQLLLLKSCVRRLLCISVSSFAFLLFFFFLASVYIALSVLVIPVLRFSRQQNARLVPVLFSLLFFFCT